MKKILTIALAMIFIMSVPVFAAEDNGNQDFAGTPVIVDAPESVFVGDEAQIVITVENIADRGIPEVSIWLNGDQVAFYEEIVKDGFAAYVIDVDASEAGILDFDIAVWTRRGNENFEAELYAGITSIEVIAKSITAEDIIKAIEDAIKENGVDEITDLVEVTDNHSTITLNINGVTYVFDGGRGINSDKSCTIDGVSYVITIQGNGNWTVL